MIHFFASMAFIEIEMKIFDNRVYMKFNNQMIEASYIATLKEKSMILEKKGEWVIMEVNDEKIGKDEQKLYENLKEQLEKGGFSVKNG